MILEGGSIDPFDPPLDPPLLYRAKQEQVYDILPNVASTLWPT